MATSKPQGIHAIRLINHDERYSPPERVLEVSLLDDVVFLVIGMYDETYTSNETKNITAIGIHKDDLTQALRALKVY